VDVSFIRPLISQSTYPNQSKGYISNLNVWSLKKPGALKIDFAPSRSDENANPSAGGYSGYDWKKKITLQLNVLEIGTLLAFNANPQATEAKFYHDPNMGTEDAGLVTKELKIVRQGVGHHQTHTHTHTQQYDHTIFIIILILISSFASHTTPLSL